MKKGFLFLLLLPCLSVAQYNPVAKNAFMNPAMQEAFDYWNISKPNTTFHSSFKPYLSSTFSDATDSAVPFKFYAFRNFFLSKTYNNKPGAHNRYNIQVHPLVDAEFGYDGILKKPMVSSLAGAHVKVNINNDFTFALTLVGGETMLPFFLDTTIRKQKILPTYGQAYGSNTSGYSFFDFTGYISYSPKNNKYYI